MTIGDEQTLASAQPGGIAILVSALPRPTVADYFLQDTSEVKALLQRLGDMGKGETR